ncbi:HEAT repeat domain-containing protein [Phenylobacterium sp.]|uniref:HEAT repeat domain-containing protein n=1 Tax=Phenylobacterium sp. TaxID=1871053 RepID=UPI002B7DAA9E|nr:HEAT repeat domain-containing protein [Phenylobacterium sp.]HVI33866.1 HEAT repeat domain-containing protein [Phenylobacterium sp.]
MPLIRKDPPPKAETPSDPAAATARLTGGTAEERWAAARELGGAPGAVDALGSALGDEADPRVREAIFTNLVRLGTSEAAAAVLPHLRADDANLRTGALDALRAMPTASAAHVPALLTDADVDVRILACELVRHLSSEEATRLLSDVLAREPEVNVCASAVDVLAECGGPAALPALQACAARFPNEAFLRFAIQVAAERIGGP